MHEKPGDKPQGKSQERAESKPLARSSNTKPSAVFEQFGGRVMASHFASDDDGIAAAVLERDERSRKESRVAPMKPRITFAIGEGGELQVYFNEAGRDLLVSEIQRLSEESDNCHLGTWEGSECELSAIPYRATDTIVHAVKVALRPDKWDKQWYPHVMEKDLNWRERALIRDILWDHGDPIGMKHMSGPKDEYDGYLGKITSLLRSEAQDDEIQEYLQWVVFERMGLKVDRTDYAYLIARLRQLNIGD
jgi:hypothetical protein